MITCPSLRKGYIDPPPISNTQWESKNQELEGYAQITLDPKQDHQGDGSMPRVCARQWTKDACSESGV